MKTFVAVAMFTAAAAVAAPFIAPDVLGQTQNRSLVSAPAAEPVAAHVDKLFAEWNRSDSPGCSLGISQNGAVVYERGYGMANLESGAAITPASVMAAASISKQFAAMSILLLAQRGKLSLDDRLHTYFPEWEGDASRVTIRQMLSHTSGLRDGFTLHELNAARDEVFDNDLMAKILARTRGLNFKPGSEFQYNNSAYSLLASIVSRVSGQPFRAFAEANIFKPLGMTHTLFQDDPTTIVPNRAWGYHQDAVGLHVSLHAYLNHIV